MIELFSLKFWVGVQFFIDLIMVGLIVGLVRRLKSTRAPHSREAVTADHKTGDPVRVRSGAEEIMAALEPLVNESRRAAEAFEDQISEKKRLIRTLNADLDTKIISINLLLSRAERLLLQPASFSGTPGTLSAHAMSGRTDIVDQQASILELFDTGLDATAIASRLAMPRGEVELVINLKKKFVAMRS